ncbi:MAG: hypothetical protein CMM31_02470 [Rhodospirillaceae bacterium]|nr:hypothetical protein [Rhodospirillaceae bacterium]
MGLEPGNRGALALSGTQALFGLDGDEIVGPFDPEQGDEIWSSQLHPDDRDRVLQRLRDHLEDDVPYDVEYRYRLPDGEYIRIRYVGRAMRDSDGKLLRMIGGTAASPRKSALS